MNFIMYSLILVYCKHLAIRLDKLTSTKSEFLFKTIMKIAADIKISIWAGQKDVCINQKFQSWPSILYQFLFLNQELWLQTLFSLLVQPLLLLEWLLWWNKFSKKVLTLGNLALCC